MTLKITLIAASAIAITLGGCTNMDGTTNNTKTGAVIGGLTGAALGGAIGKNPDTALIGGVVGAVAGAAIGNSMDNQEQELRQSLQGSGANVTNNGTNLMVLLPESVTFDFGSAVVHSGFRSSLAEVSRSLQRYPNSTVRVVGHTDNVGSANFNQQLSVDRALAVSRILINTGTPAHRLTYAGLGFSNPVASNASAAGRAMNRRVEIIITPTN